MGEIKKSEFFRLALLRIIELEDALRPFARMYGANYVNYELNYQVGVGDNKMIITRDDFQKAYDVIN